MYLATRSLPPASATDSLVRGLAGVQDAACRSCYHTWRRRSALAGWLALRPEYFVAVAPKANGRCAQSPVKSKHLQQKEAGGTHHHGISLWQRLVSARVPAQDHLPSMLSTAILVWRHPSAVLCLVNRRIHRIRGAVVVILCVLGTRARTDRDLASCTGTGGDHEELMHGKRKEWQSCSLTPAPMCSAHRGTSMVITESRASVGPSQSRAVGSTRPGCGARATRDETR